MADQPWAGAPSEPARLGHSPALEEIAAFDEDLGVGGPAAHPLAQADLAALADFEEHPTVELVRNCCCGGPCHCPDCALCECGNSCTCPDCAGNCVCTTSPDSQLGHHADEPDPLVVTRVADALCAQRGCEDGEPSLPCRECRDLASTAVRVAQLPLVAAGRVQAAQEIQRAADDAHAAVRSLWEGVPSYADGEDLGGDQNQPDSTAAGEPWRHHDDGCGSCGLAQAAAILRGDFDRAAHLC